METREKRSFSAPRASWTRLCFWHASSCNRALQLIQSDGCKPVHCVQFWTNDKGDAIHLSYDSGQLNYDIDVSVSLFNCYDIFERWKMTFAMESAVCKFAFKRFCVMEDANKWAATWMCLRSGSWSLFWGIGLGPKPCGLGLSLKALVLVLALNLRPEYWYWSQPCGHGLGLDLNFVILVLVSNHAVFILRLDLKALFLGL